MQYTTIHNECAVTYVILTQGNEFLLEELTLPYIAKQFPSCNKTQIFGNLFIKQNNKYTFLDVKAHNPFTILLSDPFCY